MNWLHPVFDGTAIVFVVMVGWYLVRFFGLSKDFPPHRHISMNGKEKILYPKGYEPPDTETVTHK